MNKKPIYSLFLWNGEFRIDFFRKFKFDHLLLYQQNLVLNQSAALNTRSQVQ
jgi:hypothetical protein